LNSVSLLEQIQDLKAQKEEVKSSLEELNSTLQKYKEAYMKVKQTKDNLAAQEVALRNQIADLEGKVRVAEANAKANQDAQSELEAVKAKASRRVVDFESLYEDIKALTEGRTRLFSSPKPKLIEVRVVTDDPANGTVYFRLIRKNAKETMVKQFNIN
jgi:septal ring factor EnvC (AmiA/AmiB activator)